MATEPKTLAGLFWDRVTQRVDGPAQRVKVGGGWADVSWRALGEEVGDLALGLVALGCRQGQSVGILSQSRAEWVHAALLESLYS